ncbi:MAG: FAD-binding protein [Halioglobus sp.]|nr:FAD-binding protein [Halioglobus sp.]
MLQKLASTWRTFRAGAAQVEAPWVLDDVDGHSWDDTVDVAVIGFGGAGAAAAIEARDHGADVAVIERFNGGGSTKISGGIVYAGGGTAIQREAGVEDTPQNMYSYLVQETGDAVCTQTLRHFCDTSAENLNWLMTQGVPFEASLCPFKTSYPSNKYYFYYSGNESFPPYSDTATPAPRGHRAHGKGVSGAALFAPLLDSARRKGVRILTQHNALGLVHDTRGTVVGVRLSRLPPGSAAAWLHRQLYALMIYLRYASMYAPVITWSIRAMLRGLERRFGQVRQLRATRGVILATGGFFYNRDMVEQYAPRSLPGMPLGTIGDDGSGILMGESVGAATDLMDNVSDWRFVNPPQAFVRGILVDANGKRLCNEMLYGAQLAERINELANGKAWLVIDAALARQALREIGPSRAMWFQSAAALVYLFVARKKAASIEQLAAKLDMPADALAQSVAAYNEAARTGEDAFGKPAEHLATLAQGPFYALDCRIDGGVRNPSITLGGLRVDERTGEVKTRDDTPISGLYAAGRAAVGVASHSYVSGLSIAGCIYAGRRAGAHAAEQGD